MLPERFFKRDLFLSIVGLSYSGDVRMGYAENPKKVENIVDGQIAEFNEIYGDILIDLREQLCTAPSDAFGQEQCEQDRSQSRLEATVASLPSSVLHRLMKNYCKANSKSFDVGGLFCS